MMSDDNSNLKQLKNEFVSLFLNKSENAESASEFIIESLLEEIILELVFETHRNAKHRIFELLNEESLFAEVSDNVLGDTARQQKATKCVCPNCNRPKILTCKFADHLEKCMGMKKSSTRIANQRKANAGKKSSYLETVSDDDDDWNISSEKPKASRKLDMKKKKLKNGPKATKNNLNEVPPASVDSVDDLASLLSLDSSSRSWDAGTNACMYLTDSPVSKKKNKAKSKSVRGTP